MPSTLHAILAWNDTKEGETPLCGADAYNRTVYHVYVDCPACRAAPAFVGDPAGPWPQPEDEHASTADLEAMKTRGFTLPSVPVSG